MLAVTAATAALMTMSGAAHAADAEAAAQTSEVVVTAVRTTRSAVALEAQEVQKIMPGASPLKAIQTLPGVLFETADPWGNNEQNESLFVHGFSTQQLGYTFDGVPLGDQQYGNYNGLSPSRAVSSENVDRVVLASGAGSLGVASTSNLGGAIEAFSRDPLAERTFNIRQTVGSYDTTRTFLRVDTGDLGGGDSGYLSFVHHDARAWDFDGHQKGNQVNAKFVHQDDRGKLTAYFDWNDKVEPNEDATAFGNQQTTAYVPYTRPFLYPDLNACSSTLSNGSPPAFQGNNFSNCFSAAQRTDMLGYVKYDYNIASNITWSNQAYYHYNYGRGIVAGPINQAGLPTLFAAYFPGLVVGSATSAATLTNISNLFGGTGNEVRTTEYRINRGGLTSTLNGDSATTRSKPALGGSTTRTPSTAPGTRSRRRTTISARMTSRPGRRPSSSTTPSSWSTTSSCTSRTPGRSARTSPCSSASSRACRTPMASSRSTRSTCRPPIRRSTIPPAASPRTSGSYRRSARCGT